MLEVEHLSYKIHSPKTDFEIKDISFRLEDGYLMGLLGKNGAGKSTLLRLLYGILPARQGKVLFDGRDIAENRKELRQKIGYLGDEMIFFENLPVSENVRVLSGLYPEYCNEDFGHYLHQFELKDTVLRQSPNQLSAGQKKQVQFAFVLARHPRLLLLDEPMGNLDPVFRVEFIDLLQGLIAREGISVILSTHVPDDIEDVADYIGILENGEMKWFGDRENVYERFQKMGV